MIGEPIHISFVIGQLNMLLRSHTHTLKTVKGEMPTGENVH